MARNDPNHLLSLVGIFTPIAIAKLTKESKGVKKVKLTDLLVQGEAILDEIMEEIESEGDGKNIKLKRNMTAEESAAAEKKKASKQISTLKTEDEPQGQLTKLAIPETNSSANALGASVNEVDDEEVEIDTSNLEMSKEESSLSAIGVETGVEAKARKEAQEKKRKSKQKSTTEFIIGEKEKMQSAQKKLKKKEVVESYDESSKVDIETEKNIKDDMSKSTNMGVLINKKQF